MVVMFYDYAMVHYLDNIPTIIVTAGQVVWWMEC